MPTTETNSSDSLDEHAFEEKILGLIEQNQFPVVLDLIRLMPIEDRPRLASRLDRELQQQLLEGMDAHEAAEFLHLLPEVQAVDLLEEIKPHAAAHILEELPLDEQADFVGDRAAFLQDGMMIEVESYEGKPLGVKLPQFVTLEVKETEPVVKGQTAANSFKPALLENGVKVMVPPFVGEGEKIVVDTTEVTYSKRAE